MQREGIGMGFLGVLGVLMLTASATTDVDATVAAAVHGVASTGADSIGVYGETNASAGAGIEGIATSATGTNYGVYGAAASADGYGLYTPNNARVLGTLYAGAVEATGIAATSLTGSLHASWISGTLSDGQLGTNVALLSGAQSFTGAKAFTSTANMFTGVMQFAGNIDACTAGNEGTVRYNNAARQLELCNGIAWLAMSAAP